MAPNDPENPYVAPQSRVEPAFDPQSAGRLRAEPRACSAAAGLRWWTAGWSLFLKDAGSWLGASLVLILIHLCISVIPLVGVLGVVLQMILMGGLYFGARQAAHGGRFEFRHLFAGFDRHGVQLGLAGFLAMLITVAMLFAATIAGASTIVAMAMAGQMTENIGAILGSMALVLIILVVMGTVLGAMFCFVPTLIVNHNLNAWEAIKMSFLGCMRNILPLTVFGLVAIFFAVLAVIPLLLGLFVWAPVMIAANDRGAEEIFVE